MRSELEKAYLSNQIPLISKAIEKASEQNGEAQLDKVIEACKNRIEKLELQENA